MSEPKSLRKSDDHAHTLTVGQPSRLISRGLKHLQHLQDKIQPVAQEMPPRFQFAWGGEGSRVGELSYPWGVTQDSDGLVYVADYGNHRIQVFDETGAVRRIWGTWGANPGQFYYPRHVCLDPWGRIVVADVLNYRIQVFTSAGSFVEEWPCSDPEAIAVDGEGCVYVTSSGSSMWIEGDEEWIPSDVTKFSPYGEVLEHWSWNQLPWESGGLIYTHWGIAIGPHGEVYVGLVPNDASQWPDLIQRWNTDGSVVAEWTGPEAQGQRLGVPKGLATDSDGNLYVGSTFKGVQKFTCDGRFLWQFDIEMAGRSFSSNVMAVFANDANELFVADGGQDLVLKFGPEG